MRSNRPATRNEGMKGGRKLDECSNVILEERKGEKKRKQKAIGGLVPHILYLDRVGRRHMVEQAAANREIIFFSRVHIKKSTIGTK